MLVLFCFAAYLPHVRCEPPVVWVFFLAFLFSAFFYFYRFFVSSFPPVVRCRELLFPPLASFFQGFLSPTAEVHMVAYNTGASPLELPRVFAGWTNHKDFLLVVYSILVVLFLRIVLPMHQVPLVASSGTKLRFPLDHSISHCQPERVLSLT